MQNLNPVVKLKPCRRGMFERCQSNFALYISNIIEEAMCKIKFSCLIFDRYLLFQITFILFYWKTTEQITKKIRLGKWLIHI